MVDIDTFLFRSLCDGKHLDETTAFDFFVNKEALGHFVDAQKVYECVIRGLDTSALTEQDRHLHAVLVMSDESLKLMVKKYVTTRIRQMNHIQQIIEMENWQELSKKFVEYLNEMEIDKLVNASQEVMNKSIELTLRIENGEEYKTPKHTKLRQKMKAAGCAVGVAAGVSGIVLVSVLFPPAIVASAFSLEALPLIGSVGTTVGSAYHGWSQAKNLPHIQRLQSLQAVLKDIKNRQTGAERIQNGLQKIEMLRFEPQGVARLVTAATQVMKHCKSIKASL